MAGKKVDERPTEVTVPAGSCAVDIRVFLLTFTIAMSAAFLAGVSIHVPVTEKMFLQTFRGGGSGRSIDHFSRLELSPAEIATAGSHSPSGQHLLVDMKGIEAAFLDSEERISEAMVQSIKEAGLSLLSYHCHKLEPAGISCVGILLESHIAFHTWPEEGVITLDLFTCGANPLLPVLPSIQRLFGIGDNIETKWAHELRGFRSTAEKKANYLDNFSDLSTWVLSPLELQYKRQIYSNLTQYQRVDIWDITEYENTPSYEDGIKHNLSDGDERWYKPDLYTPDRLLFLDGTLQSCYSSEAVYHEALVHPAMFAHAGPKRVAVLGGAEGATIREVLKHKTVEHVTMVEIDHALVEIAQEFLPKMSDCSDFVGRADNCFDDETLTLHQGDAVEFFTEEYGYEKPAADELFDVLIVDALDPEDDVLFARDLYADDAFVTAMFQSLSADGVLVIQIGTAPELSDPDPDVGVYQVREELFNLLAKHTEVAAMFLYEEAKSGFLEPHSFLVVCKDISCRQRWYSRADAIDYEIYERILDTKSKSRALKHYDGVTHRSYQQPPKAWESVYCRRTPTPWECQHRSLDVNSEIHEFYVNDEERSSFRIDVTTGGDGQPSAAVFATVDIPKGSYIMPEHLSKSLALAEDALVKLKDGSTAAGFKELEKFVDAHARASTVSGTSFVEVGASTLIRSSGDGERANVGPWVPVGNKRPPYSPVYDRNRMTFEVFMVATEDIAAGSELLR